MEEDQQQQQPQKTSQDQPLSIPSTNVTDELDPNPDLHSLFLAFNDMYFEGKLSACVVRWSSRMTLCAGTCRFQSSLVTITLSESLLKFRPRSDMIDTLLHEMIHALLFVTRKFDNRDGHGPEFLAYADRINKLAGTNITVYHTFHDEVKHHQTHVWRCDGPCRERAPYFGWVKRSMNRPPQKADRWFADHQQQCGGTYHKVSSPPKKESAKDKGSGVDKKYGKGRRLIDDDSSSTKISDFFGSSKKPRKDGR
ncbi:hypothetical protein DM01DRAFT_257361 [Hesseltinella vesiculosa]|uniref:SprT-like domain-containing protein n=1 Tax=Hesseltinella vesiculosa TaxID=101127 RepID=A0A1X2GX34_9FUNG|nr:hypothetical protein DM01DRAFT_257361 [Hesseltinella vesiculosa]